MTVWFTADLHIGDRKTFESQRKSKFGTLENHDQHILDFWRAHVKRSDVLYVIGDLCVFNTLPIIRELPGVIHLIIGNRDEGYTTQDFDCGGIPQLWTVSDQEIFHSIRAYNTVYDRFMLSHLPLHDATIYDGYINLHGHRHGIDWKMNEKHIDCGINVWDYQFLTLERIMRLREAMTYA